MTPTHFLPITEISQVGDCRRAVAALAQGAGLSEPLRGQLSIIVTELANNLVKHTPQGGSIVYREIRVDGEPGIEVLALDQGPGMEDVARCLGDGYSTAGSPGTGLGAVVRFSTEFDIYSRLGGGTAILSRTFARDRWAAPTEAPVPALEIGAVCVPVVGERVCGDGWEADVDTGMGDLMIVDGLGHGPLAHLAAQGAVQCFAKTPGDRPQRRIEAIHFALRGTRGAAVAVAHVESSPGKAPRVHYAGVGNTVAVVLSREGESKRMVSLAGTAGLQMRKVQEFDYPWGEESVLVMHSDGISTNWNLDQHPGLLRKHPSLIAGVLYRDFARGRDDATVLVAVAKGGHA